MEEILSAAEAGNELSIDRCRDLLGDDAGYTTGQVLHVNGGLYG